MTSELLKLTAYEAKNELVLSLEQAFEELKPELRPPFPLTIPSPQEFSRFNLAILYGVLTESHLAKTHIKHLHAIVTDGYALFGSLILKIVNDLYGKLVDSVKDQLVWVVKEMVDVLGVGFDSFLVCLLRQIVGGDFSDGNLWLCFELVSLFSSKWDCLLEDAPFVLTSALYVYLRVLADHCKVSTDAKLESLKRLEIEFCVKMLREQFNLCMKIGRDLIRLLRDLVHVPEFQAIWKDMVLNPSEFRTEGFSDISQLYCSRTSSRYFLLRITPEMEAHLRFLLMHVKFGNQKRYQMWFAKKFLFGQERETIVADIIRFICCAHHPSNETIQSDIIPRWAVIGWLLKSCRKKYVEANTKLALFYDWLFFDEKIDNIMNIEPAMLLMVCSIPKYVDITHSLLEFLLFIAENYEVDRNYVIIRGLSSSMRVLVQKGVVRSMDILTSCDALSPLLREGLRKLILRLNMESNELPPAHLPPHSMSHSSLQNVSHLAKSTPAPERQSAKIMEVGLSKEPADSSIPISGDSFTTSCPSNVASESQFDAIESLVQNLADAMKKSNRMGLQILEEILLSFVNLDGQASTCGSTFPENLSSKIVDQFESVGYQLFAPFDVSISVPYSDSGIHSPTVLIARSFILSQHERLQEMLLFWSRNGFQVGAHLLFYAARLAYEACISDSSGNAISSSNFSKISDSGMSLFLFHVDGYFSIQNGRKQGFLEGSAFTSKMDKEFVNKLVKNAFVAYKCFLERSRTILHKEDDLALSKQFILDITSCFLCERKKTKFFYSIFCHLADLCAGNTDIIRFLVSQLDHADLLEMQFEIGLKGLSVFGESTEDIFHLMKISVSWDPSEQHKLWGLIRSELSVSKVQLEKIILKIFCSNELDANTSAIAVGGLLTLCSCRAPTPELVGAIMLLPNDVFQDFAATVLASWVVSHASMLFDSLTKFSEKFDNENGNAAGSVGIAINHSAILWLLNYFKSHGMNDSNILSTFSASISCEKPA
ncbi:INTEGRATOR COMPLEX SUBUNIT 3 [Salix purpurea]|uniref:INTEGRATOR COMPLEX SUBUNIT 3 n=1 Tax=Salix purpurea TaxID=77065 RepID=A0A9Q0VUD5_SALPP|nr:INTEGRATOR COMPLEX SUBUNIT 3 [Salix purpurea]